MTPRPPSREALVLLATNCPRRQHRSFPTDLRFELLLSPSARCPSTCFLLFPHIKQRDVTHIITLPQNNPPFTMSTKRPPDLTIRQLLRANLPRKSSIRLIKHVLTADLDLRLQVLPHQQQKQSRGGDHDFGFGVEGGFIQVLDYGGDGGDGAVPSFPAGGELASCCTIVGLGERWGGWDEHLEVAADEELAGSHICVCGLSKGSAGRRYEL